MVLDWAFGCAGEEEVVGGGDEVEEGLKRKGGEVGRHFVGHCAAYCGRRR